MTASRSSPEAPADAPPRRSRAARRRAANARTASVAGAAYRKHAGGFFFALGAAFIAAAALPLRARPAGGLGPPLAGFFAVPLPFPVAVLAACASL